MITDKYQNKTIGIIALVMIKTNLKYVGYIMVLARIIFNKSNKTLWYVTLNVVWFNTV